MSITKNTEKTTEGLDRKEFEEWWPKLQSCFTKDVHIVLKAGAKQAWLTSRRVLREQLGKWHDVEKFYKE